MPARNQPIMLRLQLYRSETAKERSTHTRPVIVADNQPARVPPPEIEKLQDDRTAQIHMALGGIGVHGVRHATFHTVYCKYANVCAKMACALEL